MTEWDDTFLLTWPLFVVAPFPHQTDTSDLVQSFVTGISVDGVGAEWQYVCVFTDLDLAGRFLEENDLAPDHRVMTFPDLQNFAAALDALLDHGQTHIGIDPAYGRVRRIAIPVVVEAVRGVNRDKGAA